MLAEVIVSDSLFAALAMLGTAIVLGLFGWVLTQAVTLGRVVSRLESDSEDHERRLAHLEAIRDGSSR